MQEKIKLTEEEAKALWTVYREFYEEDRLAREELLCRLKKLEYFWHGYHFLVPSHGQNNKFFMTPELDRDVLNDDESTHYTKVENIYRAHGESIIAALSVEVPVIKFNPDDADESDDIETAEAKTDLASLVQRHNKSTMNLTKALHIIFNQSFIAGWCRVHSSKKYGYVDVETPVQGEGFQCPRCHLPIEAVPQICPSCKNPVEPEKVIFESSRITPTAKNRVLIDFYGPLHVFIPHHYMAPEDVKILCLSRDVHYTELRFRHKDSADLIHAAEDPDAFERWAREPVEYKGYRNTGLAVEKKIWFEPDCFMGIQDQDIRDRLLKVGKSGLCATFVNDLFIEAYVSPLHDEWTISYNPLSNTIYCDPVGKPLIQMNEMINELNNLTLQTIEHGIPQTFVDPEVLNFEAYRNTKVQIGGIYPAKPPMGKPITDSFLTTKTATLSSDVKDFSNALLQKAQFVVGSFPSIYGGQMTGSRTAAEYQMSRTQALQRLSITWKIVTHFWSDLMDKATTMYANAMVADEKFSDKTENGYINVFIRKSALSGRIGSVEPETADIFPITWAQKRDILMELIQMQNEVVNMVMADPKNLPLIKRMVGLPELVIPGADDREKQRMEIDLLLTSGPVPSQDGMTMESTVPIEPRIDDHMIHVEECKMFLNSKRGIGSKQVNPEGYLNVVAHQQSHEMFLMQEMMQNGSQPAAGGNAGTGTTGGTTGVPGNTGYVQ